MDGVSQVSRRRRPEMGENYFQVVLRASLGSDAIYLLFTPIVQCMLN